MRFKLLTTRNAALFILSVLLALCLAFGIYMLSKTALAVDGDETETYAHTYILGASGTDTDIVHYYEDMSAGWVEATAQTEDKVLVRLASDWDITDYLLVPSENDITLDLNGHVLDRGLTSATSNGYIINVVGTLTITDSDPTAGHIDGNYIYNLGTEGAEHYLTKLVKTTVTGGIITGGYSSDTVGGIWVSGKLTLNGGTIYGNTTTNQYGGGVYVEQYSSFTMNGGAIVKNAVNYNGTDKSKPAMGGGVAVYGAGAQFTMIGGLIADNVSKNTGATSYSDANGGGVEIYGTNANQAKFTMTGGTINNNRTVAPYKAQSVGGAIGVQYAVVEISGGVISDNCAQELYNGKEGYYSINSHGSAIGANATNNGTSDEGKKITALTISGGTITRNVAFYGAIYMFGDQYYTGGEVLYNISMDASGIKINDSISGVTTDSTAKTDVYISGTFSFHDNYWVDPNLNLVKDTQGNPVYVDGSIEVPYMDINDTRYGNPKGTHDIIVGKFEEGVKRSIFVSDYVLDSDIGVTVGYAKNNSNENGIPINPNKYFVNGRPASEVDVGIKFSEGDEQGKLVLNSEGEVAFTSLDKIVFTVTYDDDSSETFDYFNYDNYGTSFTYSEKTVTSIKFNDEEIYNAETADEKINGADTYKFTEKIGNNEWENYEISALSTIFYVVVLPKEITENDDNFEVEFDTLNIYNGKEHKPVTSVKYNDNSLVENVDYELSYSNNVSAGKNAEAKFTFIGNYTGEVTKYFTIITEKDIVYNLSWEYFDGTNWVELDDQKFVYNEKDQSGSVRAELTTILNTTSYVYANNLNDPELQNTTNMYLQFTVEEENVDKLFNAGTYTVTIEGEGNYTLPPENFVTVTIAPKEITFGSLDYEDGEKNRLWQLQFGTSTSNLRDEVTYIDGDGAVVGKEIDAYARFRDMLLTIGLNPNYIYDEHPLSYYLDIAEVTYKDNSNKGTLNTVTTVNTTVELVFNGNYAVSGTTDNTVTLEKTWYIVTINNGLLNSDGSTATLPEFTYGEQTAVQPLKPEHGDTVYFTIRQGTSVKWRIAVKYSNDYASKTFYTFTVMNESYVLIDVMPDTNYFASVINLLDAGNYQLDAHIDGFTDDEQVVYYAVDRTFTFTVNAYDIKTGETAKRVGYEVITPEIVFSNSAKAPEVTVTFDGNELVYGTDFNVTTSAVNAGSAVAQINGIGNFSGSIEVAFTITKANNEWQSAPNIIRWVYGGFNSSVNVITSTPKYISAQESVAYTVLDSDKKEINSTLTNFHVENGVATTVVANELAKLGHGTYYLVSKLNGSDNYYGLDTSANPLEFNVIKATNVWLATPSVIQWHYDEFDKDVNLIYAVPKYLDEGDSVKFSVLDAEGKEIDGLVGFTAENGVVSAKVEGFLNNLSAGTYYLVATVAGNGNYEGLDTTAKPLEFSVYQAVNSWKVPFDVIGWAYNGYDKDTNLILGSAVHGAVEFTVSTDGKAVEGLESFTVVDGIVDNSIATILSKLTAGEYSVTAKVVTDDNYTTVADGEVTLTIAKAGHVWEDAPSIMAWVKGEYDETENGVIFIDIFGNTALSKNVDILIYDANLDENDINDDNVVYKVVNGEVVIDKLADAGVGHYTLKVTVKETDNYYGSEKTFNFQIFAPEGLAWWAWLLIIVGILGVIALVFFILHEKGVLQMLTGKFVIAMRTKMTVDATIAAVRANMVAERSAKTRAEAQKKDRLEEMRKAREEAKQRPADEQAAALEEQAALAAKKAEKMQKRAASMQKRADKMRAKAGDAEAEQEATATDETDSTEE